MGARDGLDWVDLIARFALCLIYGAGACVVAFMFYFVWVAITSGSPEYTVTITGVDGLDPATLEQRRSDQAAAAISPVFDIALRIDNILNKADERCIGKHSSAVVSYGDAVLGRGTVPELCVQELGEGETTATAWAMDVQMPRFLRDRLAGELERGEAMLDVAVRAPGSGRCSIRDCVDGAPVRKDTTCYVLRCMDLCLDCKSKIGGGPSPPCSVTHVDPRSTTTHSFKR